jgi:mediator of RNA polymerase II transcription subunit 17
LAQKIDFSGSVETVEKMETGVSAEDDKEAEDDSKELASFQASLWPWDSVRSKLKNSLTEMSVLLDVIRIAKDKRYLVLDPVSQDPQEYKPINLLVSKKKALQSAALILLSSAEHLRSAQSDMQRNKASDFHVELMNMRKKWRLKKVGNTILGDLSYRNGRSLCGLIASESSWPLY